jgi:hypothetical protein
VAEAVSHEVFELKSSAMQELILCSLALEYCLGYISRYQEHYESIMGAIGNSFWPFYYGHDSGHSFSFGEDQEVQ